MGSPILLLAQAPLPPQINPVQPLPLGAPAIRGWHFARALSEAGYLVELVAISPDNTAYPLPEEPITLPGVTFHPLTTSEITNGALSALIARLQPAAVVATYPYPAYLASLYLPDDMPFWADFHGSPLAEGQAKAFAQHNDGLLEPFARYERQVLRRADKVSVVSTPQKFATIGALATHGRLNQFTDGYDFVEVIRSTLDPFPKPTSPEKIMRGKIVPSDAFVVLWSGGFNTWTDVDTLFAGLELAMAQLPNLHFVATGGALGSHDAQTYPRFQGLVASSSYSSRYHLLGWQPIQTLHNYYLESDVGVILDRWSYEGLLGCRTRLLDWAMYGLPAIVTTTAELPLSLATAGAAFDFPHRNPAALAAVVGRLVHQPEVIQQASQKAKNYVLNHHPYAVACQPLIQWLKAPHLAPDHAQMLPIFATTDDNATALRLLELEQQILLKNNHITDLEEWAHSLETRLATDTTLSANLKNYLANTLRRFRP